VSKSGDACACLSALAVFQRVHRDDEFEGTGERRHIVEEVIAWSALWTAFASHQGRGKRRPKQAGGSRSRV